VVERGPTRGEKMTITTYVPNANAENVADHIRGQAMDLECEADDREQAAYDLRGCAEALRDLANEVLADPRAAASVDDCSTDVYHLVRLLEIVRVTENDEDILQLRYELGLVIDEEPT
jgi:phosphoribosylformylglycinamidine (FGAM) synthase PurS component